MVSAIDQVKRLPNAFLNGRSSMFTTDVYRSRRRRLVRQIASGLMVIPGHRASPINFVHNVYPFRQDSTFLYFGGPAVPDFVMLVDADADESHLYGPATDAVEALWTGAVPTVSERAETAAFDRHGDLAVLEQYLKTAQRQDRDICYLPPYRADQVLLLGRLLTKSCAEVAASVWPDLIRAVVDQRSVKTDQEVAEIEQALGTCQAMYQAAIAHRLENQSPLDIVGRMAAVAMARDSRFAFAPIVTPRGDILHGAVRPEVLNARDLLIMDIGAESPRGYASDITRTLPTGGRFTSPQREIYEIVLKAQKAAIAAIAPGKLYRDIHLEAAKVISQGLTDVGVMHGDVDAAVAEGAHALFFPHGLGHMLGLDAHDMEALGEDFVGYDDEVARSEQFGLNALRLARRLERGFTLTVEPGIYFNRALIEKWRRERRAEAYIHYDKLAAFDGFGGIRLEDDILVTDDGARVLGPTIPKSVATVEAARP
jgi:Xaa-Pro aminopeptidase